MRSLSCKYHPVSARFKGAFKKGGLNFEHDKNESRHPPDSAVWISFHNDFKESELLPLICYRRTREQRLHGGSRDRKRIRTQTERGRVLHQDVLSSLETTYVA